MAAIGSFGKKRNRIAPEAPHNSNVIRFVIVNVLLSGQKDYEDNFQGNLDNDNGNHFRSVSIDFDRRKFLKKQQQF